MGKMSEDPPTTTTKKHVTTACTCCRRRKVKCDGKTPTCSNCKLYKQDCKYNHGEDRRKLSPKKSIQVLTDRIRLLEDLLRANGIEVPQYSATASPGHESNLSHTSGGDDEKRLHVNSSQNLQAAPDSGLPMEFTDTQLTNLLSNDDWMDRDRNFTDFTSTGNIQQNFQTSWNPFQSSDELNQDNSNLIRGETQTIQHSLNRDSRGSMSVHNGTPANLSEINYSTSAVISGDEMDGQGLQHPEMLPPAQIGRHSDFVSKRRQSSKDWHNDNAWSKRHELLPVTYVEQERKTQDDEIVDQLSARMGSFHIAEDGQLFLLGATSNLHILHNGLFSLSRSKTRSMRLEGSAVLERAGLGQIVDAEVERHLEQLYFVWEDPAIHVVDEEMYFSEQAKWVAGEDGSPFYSETLKNAICAMGANLTSSTDPNFSNPGAEFFSARAKALLEIEMDSPTIATVQALVIMSAIEAAFTRDARGWLYSGMAVRLSADLGLHLDLSIHAQDGRLTSRELDVRRTTFWGVFVHDNMWSLYMGRPWGINIRDISISRPSMENDRLRQKLWKPLGDAAQDASDTSSQGLYNPIESCADSNISLCEMMRRLSRTLYAGRNLSEQELRDFATEMRSEFTHWYQTLPLELAVDPLDTKKKYLPHVLQLHMQFYAISIFLHRPFFSRHTTSSDPESGSAQARAVCISAAQSLVTILRLYREQHSLRRTNVQIVHLVFTASLIHIYNTCTSKGIEAQRALEDLQFCCQALTEIGQAYANSTRALEVIICIKREWQNKALSLKGKRSSSSIIGNESTQQQHKKRAINETAHTDYLSQAASLDASISSLPQQQFDDTWQLSDNQNLVNEASPEFGIDSVYSPNNFPLMGTFAENSLAFGYLNTIPRDMDFSEEGLNTLATLE